MRLRYTYWREGADFLGYLNDYPDYCTQGKSIGELELMLKSLYEDINSGEIAGVKKAGVLEYETARPY